MRKRKVFFIYVSNFILFSLFLLFILSCKPMGPENPEDATDTQGSVAWIFKPVENVEIFSQPAVADDDTIFAGFSNGRLYAINPEGEEMWSIKIAEGAVASPTNGSNGTIYVLAQDDTSGDATHLHAISPSGDEVWQFDFTQGLVGLADTSTKKPTLDSNGNIFVIGDEEVYSIRPNGTLRWAEAKPATAQTNSRAAVLSDDSIIYANGSGWIVALNSNGSERWSKDFGEFSDGTPVISSDETKVYVSLFSYFDGNTSDSDDGLAALDITDGGTLWYYKTNDGVRYPVAEGPDGTVYFSEMDPPGSDETARLFAFDPDIESPSWTFTPGNDAEKWIVLNGAGTKIYFTTSHGIAAIDTQRNRQWLHSWSVGLGKPTLSPDENMLYIGHGAAGELAAIYASGPPQPAHLRGYTVGNTGPAGGTIFYTDTDEEDSSRKIFFEASHVNQADEAAWGPENKEVDNTLTSVEAGKANTEAILDVIGSSGSYTASLADVYETNGFSDWYLPSSGEIIKLLKSEVVPDTGGTQYWSSFEEDIETALRVGPRGLYVADTTESPKSDTYAVRAIRSF